MLSDRFRVVFVRCVSVALAVTACISTIVSVQAYARIGSAEATARTQLETTSANIASAADSVQTASTAMLNGATTATNVQASISSAAAIMHTVAASLNSAGNVTGFTIPFTQVRPFGSAEERLTDQAAQVAALADALDRSAVSLGANVADLRVIAADMAGIATRLREISRSVAQFAGSDTADGGLAKIADAARATALTSIFLSVLSLGVAGALWVLSIGTPLPAALPDAVAARGDQTAQAIAPSTILDTTEAPHAT